MTSHLSLDRIVDEARTKTGLSDPDSDSWREGLEILLKDHRQSQLLSERGLERLRARYVAALAARMAVDAYLRRNPNITRTAIERPVFILGMPRTGTTLVSNLMDADPANRALLKWEAYNVAPPAEPGALRSDPRCAAEKAKDAAIIQGNPKGVAQHFEAGDGPTECVHLLAQDFRSLMFAVLTTTPTYSDWLLFCDMDSAFAHRKRALQILQSTNPGRWVLKMPSDSLFVRALFRAFPDAKVIWTHRDPYAAFASSMSMRAHSRTLFNRDPDVGHMRAHYPLQLALHLNRALELSRERPSDVYHLYYDDLLSRPLDQLKQVYTWLGHEWSQLAEAGMRDWLRENPRGRFGAHRYSLSQWELSKGDLQPYFADYLRAHPVATGEEV